MGKDKINGYKTYSKEEMLNIIKNEGFLFVETSNGDNYQIRKDDVADFIMLESYRCLNAVNISMYIPDNKIEQPLLTTYGCFLNKINQKFRAEIIDRLVDLQKNNKKIRKVKVFDNDVFIQLEREELLKYKADKQFDKFYKKYYEDEEELVIE